MRAPPARSSNPMSFQKQIPFSFSLPLIHSAKCVQALGSTSGTLSEPNPLGLAESVGLAETGLAWLKAEKRVWLNESPGHAFEI